MQEMVEMTQTEVSYWVAFLKDIKEKENGKPKPGARRT
jgi:hypothetical protein